MPEPLSPTRLSALRTRAQATLDYPYAHPDAKAEAGDVLGLLAALETAEKERDRARESADQLNDDLEQWHTALGLLLADTPEEELEEVLGVRAAALIERLRTQNLDIFRVQARLQGAERDLKALRNGVSHVLRAAGETEPSGEDWASRVFNALKRLREERDAARDLLAVATGEKAWDAEEPE
jgi:hypothetical protein